MLCTRSSNAVRLLLLPADLPLTPLRALSASSRCEGLDRPPMPEEPSALPSAAARLSRVLRRCR